VEQPADGAAMVLQSSGQCRYRQIRIGKLLLDKMLHLAHGGGGLGSVNGVGEFVEHADGQQAGAPPALDGVVGEQVHHLVDLLDRRRAGWIDPGVELELHRQRFGEGAINGEPTHFVPGRDRPEAQRIGGEVDSGVTRLERVQAALRHHGGFA